MGQKTSTAHKHTHRYTRPDLIGKLPILFCGYFYFFFSNFSVSQGKKNICGISRFHLNLMKIFFIAFIAWKSTHTILFAYFGFQKMNDYEVKAASAIQNERNMHK